MLVKNRFFSLVFNFFIFNSSHFFLKYFVRFLIFILAFSFSFIYAFSSKGSDINIKTCGLISDKQNLMGGKLSDYWAQELIGSDLLKEELEKNPTPKIENWILVLDGEKIEHNILVQNLISDEGQHSVLPKLKNISFFNLDRGDETDYQEGKGHKQAISEYEINFPGDYFFGYKKRPPSFINNSMSWEENKNIYEVFKSFSSSLSRTIVITTSGNKFPYKLDSLTSKASKNFNAILVGSFSPKGFVSQFSQSDEEVSILAPSDKWITSAGKKGKYRRFGGTSGSAPLVTGSLAGFEWLSGYHPTAQEAKILLEKTALPTLHSHEKPLRNGAGLLNSYKLGEIAKRLRKKCGKNTLCFKTAILKEETYHFSEDKRLQRELKTIFPNCIENKSERLNFENSVFATAKRLNFENSVFATTEKLNFENTISSTEIEKSNFENSFSKNTTENINSTACKKTEKLFKKLRKAVLLKPNKELLNTLSCVYKTAGFFQNGIALDMLSLALNSNYKVRAELKKAWVLKNNDYINQTSPLMSVLAESEEDILRLMLGMGGFEDELKLYENETAIFLAGSLGEKGLSLLEKAFDTNKFKLQWAVISSASQLGEKGLPLLEQAFDTDHPILQERAINTIKQIGEKGLPLLQKVMNSGELHLQITAISSIGKIGEPALPLLEKAFDTNNFILQKTVLNSTGQIGEKALALIEKAFYSDNLELQELAVDSAEQIGEPALPFLQNLLKNKNLDKNIKELIEYRISRLL